MNGSTIATSRQHVRWDQARVRLVPDMLGDPAAGEDDAGVQHEVAQQPELGRGQVDRLAVPAHAVRVLVDLQVGEPQHGPAARVRARPVRKAPVEPSVTVIVAAYNEEDCRATHLLRNPADKIVRAGSGN